MNFKGSEKDYPVSYLNYTILLYTLNMSNLSISLTLL